MAKKLTIDDKQAEKTKKNDDHFKDNEEFSQISVTLSDNK